jgi:membrane protease subunit HflC
MRAQLDQEAREFGIDVVDVRIRRADFPEQNSQAVYKRMQTEREREAAEFRAQGTQKAQEIRAKADRDVTVIIAQANSQAETIRGQGDAQSNAIYAQAFSQDPDFFAFYRSMRAYDKSMRGPNTNLVLSPNLDFFRYFGNPSGKEPVQSATTPSASAPADSHAFATVPAK